MRTGSRQIIANCSFPTNTAQVEEMRNGTRVITNPTLEEFNGFVSHEAGKLGSNRTRFVVDKVKGNVHFAHAAKAVHDQIINHFGIGDDHAIGFMDKGGFSQHYVGGYNKDTQPLLKKYIHPEAQFDSKLVIPAPFAEHVVNVIGAVAPGTSPQNGYEQWRSMVGSGQNQYPTGDQASPTEPQPLDEWEQDAPRTGDSLGKAPKSGWEDKWGGKGQQRPGKRPASRYQQPWGDQNVGQARGTGRERTTGAFIRLLSTISGGP